VLSAGNKQLILCDSGISNPAQPERLALDLAALVEVKSRSHLPVIINPSQSVDAVMLASQAQAVKQLQGDGIVLPFTDIQSLAHYKTWLHSLYS
jgi:chorismate mutase / prephenate dehydratase